MTTTPLKRVLIILPWFGPWPDWMRFFLASCRANPTIDWALIGDAPERADWPANVRHVRTSLEAYRALASSRLGVECRWTDAYKICDIRPAYGVIHADLIAGYDLWGYGDLDVIYGDIRSIYTADVLDHDLVTSHAHVVAGHLTLVRNSPKMNRAFRNIWGWRRMLSQPEHRSFDEQMFTRLFPGVLRPHWRDFAHWPLRADALFVERFSTNIPPLAWVDGSQNYPRRWLWRDGRLTNGLTGDRGFLYLHFSNWQSNRWTSEAVAPWKKLARIDNAPAGELREFDISAAGFTAPAQAVVAAA